MFKVTIIGNLGADAEYHNENGNEFVAFKVAHNDRRQAADGREVESIVWASCTMNGRNEKLLPYLKKGTTVYVQGDARLKTFHSEKQRALVAGINIFVRDVQLVGAKPDTVPSRLYDEDGQEYRVTKFYNTAVPANGRLYSQQGQEFTVDVNGWVFAQPDALTPQSDPSTDTQEQAAVQVNAEEPKEKKSNAKK